MKKINPELSATPWTGGTLTDLMKEVQPEVSEVLSDKTTKKPKKKKSKKSWSNY